MTLNLIAAAAASEPNPWLYLITGAGVSVLTVIGMGKLTMNQAKRLHGESLAAASAELKTKAANDLAAEHRAAQLKCHEAFMEALGALDLATFTYAARPHEEPSRAMLSRAFNENDPEIVTQLLVPKLAKASEQARMALDTIRLVSHVNLHSRARTAYARAVTAAWYCERVGRVWSSHQDEATDDGDGGYEMIDADEVAQQRAGYRRARHSFRQAREEYVVAFQERMWGAV
ncbi:hypothetical protein [Streptomyces erythrochromogenes]|uniref:hypothetical protein n=1 Tax=Streptomyces erythrochromogenes TaxID=285574 RepID=UPI0036FA1FDF